MTPVAFPSAGFTDDALRGHWREHAIYTILQTGYSNAFLQAWAALREQAGDIDTPQHLHYLLIDTAPPTAQQLRAMAPTDALASELANAWPPLTPGYHRLLLEQGRVVLTLIIGDIAASLAQVDARVDLFLLHDDAIWNAQQLKRLARLAAPRAQLRVGAWHATSIELAAAGFTADEDDKLTAHFTPRWTVTERAVPQDRRALVIGAGLAGSAACEALAARGWQVTLIERHAHAAQEASGNLAGVVMPAISRDDNPTARLTRAAFLFAQQAWARAGVFDGEQNNGNACGVLQVARDAEQADAFEQAAQHWNYPHDYAQWWSVQEASARLGMPTGSGWFFPRGGWLRPVAVCEAMLRACGERLQRRFASEVNTLLRVDGLWQALDAAGEIIAAAPVVILANGMQSTGLAQAAALPLQTIRGQVSHLPAGSLPDLPFVLCGDGYLTGAVNGLISVGASYDRDDRDTALRADSHAGNLDKLLQLLPGVSPAIDSDTLPGRVGFRCVSADRLPLVGALPDQAALAAGGEVQLRDAPRWPQLYGLLAYASRGLIWAPLAAEIVACALEDEPAPLGKDLLALLDPARFALRAHRKN
ncbi:MULTISPECIES: FAD-dependent 5-carboxymethylaminomethyl-2-thiouridine(34) oxidoreductase MnmC [unclassified Herbaspirillum]|uniref:FAD-dependent 5-carboxymethylaminomethyl-2-thiouridine(34) oxidoreductase MnmC n=1 Tax=unclassified Herbaspirillum TaxID=2624150 RepID=UPI000E2F0CA9|nr:MULTISPECIES: FAD-dependent 5-carboxymethylaminomethyl-2-thiouridine(34) oxidoreductase MnmC [unclassified Herbaspirillum]RFB67468.1 FAD-dependent oxidoreductase [Herbaspirillum sp. 3R-3a1]TFI05074.1 FAD-dependent oxidoreductase [Herbaspirillum sp. 3R11]TFI12596.1 FAD-dependent oxidoreductase [Herbaspirillum sp. 3R-11]TFI28406.1 FAD-dependent oxidoreductase [Herbaspirillum sp. 3C11]